MLCRQRITKTVRMRRLVCAIVARISGVCRERITKALIRLRRCAGWSAPLLLTSATCMSFALQGANSKGADQTMLVCAIFVRISDV